MQCRICASSLAPSDAVSCSACGAPFHADCWAYNGRCGIYGCGSQESGPFRPPSEASLLAIDEGTRPPFRLTAWVEGAVRRLPLRGRIAIPVVLLGLLGALAGLAFHVGVLGEPATDDFVPLMFAIAFGASVLAALVGPTTRRRPLSSAVILLGGGTLCLAFLYHPITPWQTAFAIAYPILGMVGCSALVELVFGRFRSIRLPGGLVQGILRCLLTAACIYLYLSLTMSWRFARHEIDKIPVLALAGLLAVAPQFELAKAALLNRLQLEAARKGKAEKERAARL